MGLSIIRLHPEDNVAVAIAPIAAGQRLAELSLSAAGDIPQGHKIALRAIDCGQPIVKFQQIIGFASQSISPGDHVHSHNVEIGPTFDRTAKFDGSSQKMTPVSVDGSAQFMGILRPNGRVATRNYIGILTTVNCSATAARLVADHFRAPALADFPQVDGVVPLTHSLGCGGVQDGDGLDVLRRTIGGYARHPNFGAVVILGLGCENNQLSSLMAAEGLQPDERLHPIVIQDQGGTVATVREAVARIQAILPSVNAVVRQPLPARHLTLALQCGGSDGYSGITANPALGVAVDLLIRQGGTAVLSETPEIYGAEHLLARRAVSQAVIDKLYARLRWWESYTSRSGGEMNNNPSPGNKSGGLTTILEKSLGAVAKGGTSPLVDVVEYAEPIVGPGLVFMDTPGYDPVSATGQVAGGANILCFTTGRGSVYGCRPVPSLKLATNSAIYRRMIDDMDLDCGIIATGEASVAEVGQQIFAKILATASGQATKSEVLGMGADEFAPWQIGAVM